VTASLNMTPGEAEQAISAELEPGERLLWAGVPRQGLIFRANDWFLIPLSVLWTGLAIAWTGSMASSGAHVLFWFWGVPFVAVGLYLIFGRFFVDAARRSKTAYGLTDRRVLIVSELRTRSVKSIPLTALPDSTLSENGAGTGSIAFGSSHPMAKWFAGTAWPGAEGLAAPSFDFIDDAKSVYARIRSAQTQAG
jgi:hypothetical protein